MTVPKLAEVEPRAETTRVFRQIAFDVPTFDVLQDVKRFLEIQHQSGRLSNASVLRAIVMSHPEATEVSNRAREDS